jgi:Zn-dependent protease
MQTPGSEFTPQFLILGVIWYIVFLFSTTCHEGAHSLVAKIGGDTTAFHGGQVTLNPIPHIRRSPFGLVVVPIISYFLAHWMIGWGIAFGYFTVPEFVSFTHITQASGTGFAEFAATFLSIIFLLNLLLGTFNLLPVPPLDGNTGITLFMSESTALKFVSWSRSQGFGMLGLILAWYAYDRIFPFIFRFALAVLYPGAY